MVWHTLWTVNRTFKHFQDSKRATERKLHLIVQKYIKYYVSSWIWLSVLTWERFGSQVDPPEWKLGPSVMGVISTHFGIAILQWLSPPSSYCWPPHSPLTPHRPPHLKPTIRDHSVWILFSLLECSQGHYKRDVWHPSTHLPSIWYQVCLWSTLDPWLQFISLYLWRYIFYTLAHLSYFPTPRWRMFTRAQLKQTSNAVGVLARLGFGARKLLCILVRWYYSFP